MKLPFPIQKEIDSIREVLLDAIERGSDLVARDDIHNGESNRVQAMHQLVRSGHITVEDDKVHIRIDRVLQDETQI